MSRWLPAIRPTRVIDSGLPVTLPEGRARVVSQDVDAYGQRWELRTLEALARWRADP